jgi:prolyl-tRNA synthetase
VEDLLDEAQLALAQRARSFRESRTKVVDDRAGLEAAVAEGYASARWCESRTCADDMQTQTRATIRCFPFDRSDEGFVPQPDDPGACAWCGADARRRVIVARSY